MRLPVLCPACGADEWIPPETDLETVTSAACVHCGTTVDAEPQA